MWLLIYKEHPKVRPELVGRVSGTNYAGLPAGSYDPALFEVKEWDGAEPFLGDPRAGILPDRDPTLADPDYAGKVQQRVDFEGLADDAATEIAWLDSVIPTISDPVVKRLARENLGMLKAWRYVLRRLS